MTGTNTNMVYDLVIVIIMTCTLLTAVKLYCVLGKCCDGAGQTLWCCLLH